MFCLISDLYQDILISNQCKPSFNCPNCPKVYDKKKSLACHLKRECGIEPQFQCTLCSYKAKRKSSVTAHMIKHMKKNEILNIQNYLV